MPTPACDLAATLEARRLGHDGLRPLVRQVDLDVSRPYERRRMYSRI
jgi:hypothetical protein